MRFYTLDINNPTTGKPVLASSMGGQPISSLLPGGAHNPAALNLEFDIPFQAFFTPDSSAAWVRIWGLSLKDLGAAFNLNGMNVSLTAGMSKGLPLANPSQQGLLLKGKVLQAFGNWVGLDQTVDMNFTPQTGTPSSQLNFPFSWKAGTQMSTAIQQTLATGMPGNKIKIAIDPSLVIGYDEQGFYQSLQQFNDYLNARSKALIKKSTYRGITISTKGDTLVVTDGSVAIDDKDVTTILFQDLIGQPTWIGTNSISAKLVLRGDLTIGGMVKFPQGPQQTTIASNSGFSPYQNPGQKTTFQGKYLISTIHHYGNFRQADAASWNTTIEATTDGVTA